MSLPLHLCIGKFSVDILSLYLRFFVHQIPTQTYNVLRGCVDNRKTIRKPYKPHTLPPSR